VVVMNGKVYLVGAGPGDPGLITVKGLECIQKADVLVYDYLASPQFLKNSRKDAEIIYVGKKGGDHTLPQEKINSLLVEKALEGSVVTRLKGGDPFIFGRGGEEIEVLVGAGIPFEVVPGVTSAIAAPAYAGIPLTHRKHTSTLAFITGHEDPAKETSSIDWEALSRGIGTLVFFMGVKNLPHITRKLVACGKSPDTPVALIRWGTTTRQRTVSGTLGDIVDIARSSGIKAPAIIVVGEVVSLRDEMKWFDQRPLFGKKIVVTRARAQASDLVRSLADLGADTIECPTIEIKAPTDPGPMDKALKSLEAYDWLVFTSVNGVKYFFQRLFAGGLDVRALRNLKTAVIGPATQSELGRFGINSDIVPASYVAESVIEAFEKIDMAGRKILLPRAEEARPVLPEALAKMGADVHEIVAYHTHPVKESGDILIQALEEGRVDLVTFTSSSTVKNFKALIPSERIDTLMERVLVASIGPITTETANRMGFHVDITADEYTIPGLTRAIVDKLSA
jgi:uroporphyrinogen III methyltransferase / synthase